MILLIYIVLIVLIILMICIVIVIHNNIPLSLLRTGSFSFFLFLSLYDLSLAANCVRIVMNLSKKNVFFYQSIKNTTEYC